MTLGAVTAVLDLAQAHHDTTAPSAPSWEAVSAQMRALLVAQAVGLPVPGGDPGQQGNTGYS